MQPGQTLLHYRLVEKLGEGGMGVVWKALDTTLNRSVAIKVLPEVFSQDPDRLLRFEREARMLASLNHPNIATVHGLHEADGLRFLAMELVEGEDLAARLQRGRLALDDALALSCQIAAALEAAHSQGVVHRDLKPANVVVTPEGTAKVLDFGLAKVMDPDPLSGSGSLSLSPTMTSAGTAVGMILGTAAYMSPEQARGKPVDRRADLWSFGCLMYECLTGVQIFKGETVSDSLAAILRKEPDFSVVPDDTPPAARLLLRRCLTRDPRKRQQDAGDARIELEQAIEDPRGENLGFASVGKAVDSRKSALGWIPWGIAALALLLAAFFAMRGGASSLEATRAHRLMIRVPGATVFGDFGASPPAVSPDGRQVVFGTADRGGGTRLFLRALDHFTGRPLAGTEGAKYAFWSPDSLHVGFFLGGQLKRIEVATGSVQSIGGAGTFYPRGASWSSRGQIIFSPNANAGIHVVDAAGGTERQLTTPDPEIPDGSHRWPSFLPDGEHFLFLTWTNDLEARKKYGGIYTASLSGDQEPVRIVSDASSAAYARPGYLLVVRGENLVAIPFDSTARQVTGEAVVLASGVLHDRSTGHSAFSTSLEGTLVYAAGQALLPARLNWFERDGTATPAGPAEPAPYGGIRLAPSANRAATLLPGEGGDGQIWIVDLDRGVRTRLVHGEWQYTSPIWSGDGNRVLFGSQEKGNVDFYVRFADGSGETTPVLADGLDKELWDWSRDGKYLAYWPIGPGTGTPDIWIHSLERGESEPLITGDKRYRDARFSPDGRWIAYSSDESDQLEIYVQTVGNDGEVRRGARWQLSTAGGVQPHWRDDGREIIYGWDGRVMAVSVEEQQGSLVLGTPRELFAIRDTIVGWEATGDHQRFLVATVDEVSTEPLHVILNWPTDLE